MFSPLSLQHMRGVFNGAQTSAGSTQGTAATMLASHVIIKSVSAGTGLILPNSDVNFGHIVANGDSSNALLVYPPVGGSINNAPINTPLTLPAGRAALCFAQNSINYSAVF